MDRKRVGRRIRSWLEDADMTADDLAQAISIPGDAAAGSEVTGWVEGTRSIPLDCAERICDVFGTSLDELACRGSLR